MPEGSFAELKNQITSDMKPHLISLFILLLPCIAQGQNEVTDTTAAGELQLGEITVIADDQRADAVKTVYTPTAVQREAASDGLSLLARMNIAQLSVNPVSGTIKTAGDRPVSIFINYHPATDEDLAGINPADVRKVEYFDFPTDPRFLRAEHAVNFITHEYLYGGYTKLTGKQRFIVRSGDASVYSKFAYGKMEYDMMVSGNYDNNSHVGSSALEMYKFESGTICRESGVDVAKYRARNLFTAVRASWNRNENFSFRNMFYFRRSVTPVNETSGYVAFTDLYPSESYASRSNSTGNAFGWSGDLYAFFGSGWSANIDFSAGLNSNSSHQSYSTSVSEISNSADEDTYNIEFDLQTNKSLSEKLSLFAGMNTSARDSRIDYSGTSVAANRLRRVLFAPYAGVSLKFEKISGSADAGYAAEISTNNGEKKSDRYPYAHLSIQYAPNRRNSMNLWFQYATLSPGAKIQNQNLIRQSELMYVSGNPDLNPSPLLVTNLSYTWLPSNKWQLSAFAVLFRISDRQIEVFSPEAPDGMMLKKYRNDGDYTFGAGGAKLTGKFFEGCLSVSAEPMLVMYSVTGSNSVSRTTSRIGLNADYSVGKFLFNAYLYSRYVYVDGETAYLRKMPSGYSVSAGWASRGWNLQLAVVNPFRSSWKVSSDLLTSPWYDCKRSSFGSEAHRRIALSVTYTFNYGKKVSKSGELSGEGSISSSILR